MKRISWPYGKSEFTLQIPDSAQILRLSPMPPLEYPAETLHQALNHPVDSPPLSALAAGRCSAVIVVSDNTRPVPYKEPDGILAPLLDILRQSGIAQIRILIACGTHRARSPEALRRRLGDSAFRPGIEILNHIADDPDMLITLGSTSRNPTVAINRFYGQADLKILTGLVEPHFMAGYSGGRKALCPGICGQPVTWGFHSAEILDHPRADTLVLEGNPCHEESLAIAKMAGVDFTVNVTINSEKKLAGIFAGSLEQAHRAAIDQIRDFVRIPIPHEFDIVLTQAGDVGVNHYQCAKAAYEACRAACPNGHILLTADLTDPDPIGGAGYKQILPLLQQMTPQEFRRAIRDPGWTFVPEQWQVQMWAKVFQKLGAAKNLMTCAARLRDKTIPETNAAALHSPNSGESDSSFTQRITQLALDKLLRENPRASLLLLPDGPYGIPSISNS